MEEEYTLPRNNYVYRLLRNYYFVIAILLLVATEVIAVYEPLARKAFIPASVLLVILVWTILKSRFEHLEKLKQKTTKKKFWASNKFWILNRSALLLVAVLISLEEYLPEMESISLEVKWTILGTLLALQLLITAYAFYTYNKNFQETRKLYTSSMSSESSVRKSFNLGRMQWIIWILLLVGNIGRIVYRIQEKMDVW